MQIGSVGGAVYSRSLQTLPVGCWRAFRTSLTERLATGRFARRDTAGLPSPWQARPEAYLVDKVEAAHATNIHGSRNRVAAGKLLAVFLCAGVGGVNSAAAQSCLVDSNGDGHPLFGSMIARAQAVDPAAETPIFIDPVTSIAAGDVNGDGSIDAVTTHQSLGDNFPGVISVMLNEGDGMLANGIPIYLAINAAPRSVQLGRLDANASLDLVYADEATDTVVVMRGDGAGNFTQPASYPAGDEPSAIIIANLNNDAFQDIAVLSRIDNAVSVLYNNGAGVFTPSAVPFAAGDVPDEPGCSSEAKRMGPRMSAGDIDGDGDIDLAVPNVWGVSILRNNGSGIFQPPQFEWISGAGTVWSVKIANLNVDNRGDLVCAVQADCGVAVGVSLNNGDGTFPDSSAYNIDYYAPVDTGLAHVIMDVAVADLDDDGDRDVVAGFAYRTMEVILLNNGAGAFGPTAPNLMWMDVCANLGPIVLDDFNGDSRPDLAIGRTRGGPGVLRVILNEPNATGAPFQHHRRSPDLVDFAVSGVSVYPWFAPQAVAISDIDGDGRSDVIAVDTSKDDFETHLNVLRNPGDGNFESVTPTVYMFEREYSHNDFNAGMDFMAVRAGDLNCDGANDLVVADQGRFLERNDGLRSYEGSSVWVLLNLNDGAGNFAAPVRYDTDEPNDAFDYGTTDVALGDIDGDGDLDVAAINSSWPWVSVDGNSPPQTQCRLRIYRNDGLCTGTFILDPGYPLDLAYSRTGAQVSLGDLDNDGDPDLVANTAGESGVRIFLNQPLGTFTQVQAIAPFLVSDSVVLADLNDDGYQDLAMGWNTWYDPNAPDMAVYLNDQSGSFPTRRDFSFQTRARLYCAADMNSDGLTDLVGMAWDCRDVGVWTTSLTPTLHFELGRYSAAFPLWRAAPGDLDNDGDLEIVAISDSYANLAILDNRFCMAIPGDIDGSGCVDIADLSLLLSQFGCAGNCEIGDIDGSGTVDITDLAILLSHFGQCSP